MASKFIVLCAFIAAANAGDLLAPAVYSGAIHAAPIAKYSPASAVSHSYSSIAAPAALTYAAAPIAKTVAYAPAHVAVHTPAIGSTSQNVIRSFDGTISQHSKAVDTAFSSVRKVDTRINNNVYTPAIAKSVAYAAPAVYAAHAAPAVYTSHAAPAVYSAHAAPAVYSAHAAPAVYAAHAAPAVYAAHAAPAVYSAHAAPAVYAAHAAPAIYSAHAAPAVYAAHGAPATAYATKAVSYSPAAAVAHVSFEGYGTHYGW